MNNSLTNFSTDPNSPNYGEKHKAPRSYTSPTIIVGPDFYMGIGSLEEIKFQRFLMKSL